MAHDMVESAPIQAAKLTIKQGANPIADLFPPIAQDPIFTDTRMVTFLMAVSVSNPRLNKTHDRGFNFSGVIPVFNVSFPPLVFLKCLLFYLLVEIIYPFSVSHSLSPFIAYGV